jgi:hypothetical protein
VGIYLSLLIRNQVVRIQAARIQVTELEPERRKDHMGLIKLELPLDFMQPCLLGNLVVAAINTYHLSLIADITLLVHLPTGTFLQQQSMDTFLVLAADIP